MLAVVVAPTSRGTRDKGPCPAPRVKGMYKITPGRTPETSTCPGLHVHVKSHGFRCRLQCIELQVTIYRKHAHTGNLESMERDSVSRFICCLHRFTRLSHTVTPLFCTQPRGQRRGGAALFIFLM